MFFGVKVPLIYCRKISIAQHCTSCYLLKVLAHRKDSVSYAIISIIQTKKKFADIRFSLYILVVIGM